MILLKMYIFLVMLQGCFNESQKNIIIVGRAEDLKDGAIVVSNSDKKMYYLSGVDFWDRKVIGKTVKVSGKLLVENKEAPKEGQDIPQQVTGIKRIILQPKWEVVIK
jgi:hypothetical protein